MSEFFPGALDDAWAVRRAALLEEEERRRGGAGGTGEDPFKRRGGGGVGVGVGVGKRPSKTSSFVSGSGQQAPIASPRPVAERLTAVAKGSQPAVVKLASYGSGVRLGAMATYVSREGDLALENERGELLQGRADLERLHEEWSPLFLNRNESRDIAGFAVEIEPTDQHDDESLHRLVRHSLQVAFGERRFAYGFSQAADGRLKVEGVLVLRAQNGERLTGDHDAAEIVQVRYRGGRGEGPDARFSFQGHGNGVEYGTAKLRALVENQAGEVWDERGRAIGSAKSAGDLVQREWRKELHSRKGRDVMHVILSARAGTDTEAFTSASRDFLASQFEGFHYAFALHDPKNDPKEQMEGGKRPHIHVHALVLMRNEDGERIITNPHVFRQWRELLAEKARDHGIAMEMTDRREMATAPAFGRNQVRVVSRAGRTLHVGTSDAAQIRYDNKRAEVPSIATSVRGLAYAFEAKTAWRAIAAQAEDEQVAAFAKAKERALSNAIQRTEIGMVHSVDRGEFKTEYEVGLHQVAEAINEGKVMRDMTADQFQTYEKNVEGALQRFEAQLDDEDRPTFEKVAEAARGVVAARREVLQLQQQLEQQEAEARPNSIVRELASSIASMSPTVQAIKALDGITKTVAETTKDAIKDGVEATEATAKKNLASATSVSRGEDDGEEKWARRGFPAEITSQYFVKEAQTGATRVYADSKATREVFQDAGEKLRSKTYDPTAVRLMVETAAHRGWTSVEIKGSKEFRREAWLEGQARGITVKGYSPSQLDWQEVSRREQTHLKNEIARVEEKAVVAKPATKRDDKAAPVVDEKTTTGVAKNASTKDQTFRDGVTGILVEQGQKPYQDDPKNEQSNYVVLRTEKGERTVWGVGLPDALYRAGAKEGDTVTLREAGMEKVQKTVIREVDGQKVQQEVTVDRRAWEAEVAEQSKEPVAKAEASSNAKTVVEGDKAASTNEAAKDQTTRLQQLVQEHQAKRDRDEQER